MVQGIVIPRFSGAGGTL